MCGLREGDFGNRGHDHAPQPLAPEDLVDGRSHRDQPLERYLRPATPGPARARQLQECLAPAAPSCAVPWSIRDRSLLEDLVEIDEATLPFRTAKDPTTGGQGRSRQGKMRIAGAVELSPEGEPRRSRLAPIGDFSARSLHAFVAGTSAPGARVITDGWSGYPGLPDHDHQPKVVGATPAHLVLIWIHRVFSNLKRWALGTFHGLRRAHLRRYLDEFVFRWNRRRHTATAFDTLLGIGARLRPADYRDIVGQRV